LMILTYAYINYLLDFNKQRIIINISIGFVCFYILHYGTS